VDAHIIEIKVECYAGYRGEETPRIFWFKSRKIEVKKVLDRWLDPDHRYFRIAGWIQITAILKYWATTKGSISYAMI
jgi:hypothetical protein